MSIKRLPGVPMGRPNADVRPYISPNALARWDSGVRASADDARAISIYDAIGHDLLTGDGVTAKRVAAALRAMGPGPVTVNINSPGGDMFEGLAIYNLLREHDGEVTVKVLGLAASAASIIAMAGDEVQVARSGFLMIHNAWVCVCGNRNDLREIADTIEPFDRAMAEVYAARTGESVEDVAALMDRETWMGGSEAIERGFADGYLPSDQLAQSEGGKAKAAIRRLESALRACGLPKSEAIRLLSEIKAGTGEPASPGAGDPADNGPATGNEEAAAVLAALKSFSIRV